MILLHQKIHLKITYSENEEQMEINIIEKDHVIDIEFSIYISVGLQIKNFTRNIRNSRKRTALINALSGES